MPEFPILPRVDLRPMGGRMQPQMSYAEHARAVMRLGLPLIGGHLAQFAIGLTDTIMLGWYEVEALAAQVLAGSLFFSIFIVGSGFAWAVTPMIASAEARGDQTTVRRVTRMALWICGLFSVVVFPAFWVSGPVLEALGQAPHLAEMGQAYLRVMAFTMLPHLIVMAMKSYLSALERTQIVFWLSLMGAFLNVLLNYVLIFGNFGAPELGIQGAAMASLLVSLVSALVVIIYAQRIFPAHALFRRFWRLDREAFARVFALGLPIGGANFAEVGLFSASAIMMGWVGTLPLAAHGIAIQLASATFLVHLGLSNVATIRAGNAEGRGDRDHLARGARVVMALSVAFAMIAVAAFLLFPRELQSLFLDPDEPQRNAILAIGTSLLIVAAVFQLFDGAQVIALGLLRGLQDTQVPMLIAVFSYWGIGLGASYVMGFALGWGGIGIWLGLVLGLAVAAALMLRRFWRILPIKVP